MEILKGFFEEAAKIVAEQQRAVRYLSLVPSLFTITEVPSFFRFLWENRIILRPLLPIWSFVFSAF